VIAVNRTTTSPSLGIVLSPMIASAAMALSAVNRSSPSLYTGYHLKRAFLNLGPAPGKARQLNRTLMGYRPNWQSYYVSIKCDLVAIDCELIAQDARIVTSCRPHQRRFL
jgi:hypothetical protein